MIVLGGRTSANDEMSSHIEVYDTESSDWYRVPAINRYRHAIIQVENHLLMHGGFEPEYPNKPLDTMLSVDISRIGNIYPRLAKVFGKDTFINGAGGSILNSNVL